MKASPICAGDAFLWTVLIGTQKSSRSAGRSFILFSTSTERHAPQSLELAAHRAIAFAGRIFQLCPVQYLYMATDVLNHPRFLKRWGHYADAGAIRAQHGGQKLLRQVKIAALRPVMDDEHPTRKPLVNMVQLVAGNRCET